MTNLLDFIIYARKNTYASGKKPETSLEKRYVIEQENFKYQDLYYDQKHIFQGQETVFYKDHPIWSCGYRGIVQDNQDPKPIFTYLKKALLDLSNETRFHLISSTEFEKWQYSCKGQGTFNAFHGIESIHQADILLYSMHYFGGILR
ncbi:MAG: hypothetical protein EBZ47_09140 [Chlamydiae bacterium]|nr:hypothetical protein [Chlamydiota bacterium]